VNTTKENLTCQVTEVNQYLVRVKSVLQALNADLLLHFFAYIYGSCSLSYFVFLYARLDSSN